MRIDELPELIDNEVVVIYSGQGGIPYIHKVTRNREAAVRAYHALVTSIAKPLSASEATEWVTRNKGFEGDLEAIGEQWYLARSETFDAFWEVVVVD